MFLNFDNQTIIIDRPSINPPNSPERTGEKIGEGGRKWE